MTSVDRSVSGRFTTDGNPVAGGEVALFGAATGELLAIAATDDGGGFVLSVPADGGELGGALLVARALRDPIGLATRPLEPADVDLDVDAAGPWHQLVVELAPTAETEPPAGVEVFLDPVRPGEPRSLTRASAPGVERAHFVTLELTGRRTAVRVQAGRWRLAGSRIVYERPQLIEPDFSNYVTGRATVAADELGGDPWSGFELTVDVPRTVVLHLRTLADGEL